MGIPIERMRATDEKKLKKTHYPGTMLEIVEINRKADKEHLSYGNYVFGHWGREFTKVTIPEWAKSDRKTKRAKKK